MTNKKIRVLITKPGIDGHWRGGIVVARALRDAGMELIFGGFQNIDQIVESAIHEDVDVIGMSIHSGAHMAYTRQLFERLKEKGVENDFLVILGGVIPVNDFPRLKGLGVANIFGPGTITKDIVDFITNNIES
ncbi:MAG: cobalamin B12-binding domain-containing protein [Candidatus Lokiarchaeota archaeon]|nr:cobalamin B12-binding domain-containing protein [Candidatus Lokiarchaeota archaeon]